MLCTAEAGQCSVHSHSHQLVGEGCWELGHKRSDPFKELGTAISQQPDLHQCGMFCPDGDVVDKTVPTTLILASTRG